jgi:hypothetical protein
MLSCCANFALPSFMWYAINLFEEWLFGFAEADRGMLRSCVQKLQTHLTGLANALVSENSGQDADLAATRIAARSIQDQADALEAFSATLRIASVSLANGNVCPPGQEDSESLEVALRRLEMKLEQLHQARGAVPLSMIVSNAYTTKQIQLATEVCQLQAHVPQCC